MWAISKLDIFYICVCQIVTFNFFCNYELEFYVKFCLLTRIGCAILSQNIINQISLILFNLFQKHGLYTSVMAVRLFYKFHYKWFEINFRNFLFLSNPKQKRNHLLQKIGCNVVKSWHTKRTTSEILKKEKMRKWCWFEWMFCSDV